MSLDLRPGIYHGALIEVVEAEGTGLVGDHALGATVLNVAAGGFRTAGQCRVNGATYAYVREGDALTITPGLLAAADDGTPVESLTPAGEPETRKLAVVDLDMLGEEDDTGNEDANLPRAEIPGEWSGFYPLGPAAAGTFVNVEDTTYGYRVTGRPTDAPLFNGALIDPTSTIPGGQAFSLDAPTATDGYPEDYGWWQVDGGGNVLGFWRLVGGVWTAQTIVTQEALQVGNILVDALNGETITGVTVTGSTVQTAASGARWVMTSADASRLSGYSGGASEVAPALLATGVAGSDYYLRAFPPMFTGVTDTPLLEMLSHSGGSEVTLSGATDTHVDGANSLTLAGGNSVEISGATVTLLGNVVWAGATSSWTTYTPSFTAATTNPTLGSFTRAGRWSRWGKTIRFSIVITATAASGFGTGAYSFGLPVAARAVDEAVLTASQSGPNRIYVGRNGANTTEFSLFQTSDFAAMTSVNSGIISGTILRINGTYEAA